MKRIIIGFTCMFFCLSICVGQYTGGSGKGVARVVSLANLGNNIFKGGSNEGFTLIRYTANLGNNIFKGGAGDGFVRIAVTSNLGNNIFKGGSSDGEAFFANQSNLGVNIFKGGSGDGETRIASTVNAGINIFKGGSSDGWGKVSVSILLQPGVYTFTGNGLWTNSSNWYNNTIPPAILPSAYKIVINPADGGECILNTVQTIQIGATLIVNPGKILKVPSVKTQ